MTEIVTPEEREELAALHKEAMDLLRQAQTCQTELTAIRFQHDKDQVRAALAGRVNTLHRQRFAIRQRAKTIEQRIAGEKRAVARGAVADLSPTTLLREAAKRAGILEELYVELCRAADGAHREDFDWRYPLAKARGKLGERPALDDAESPQMIVNPS